ncbi:MAG: hypothetical protein ACREFB_01490 [Stellaceae bacterium]
MTGAATYPPSPSFPLATMYERGSARVVLLPGVSVADGTAIWHLLIQEGPVSAERPRAAVADGNESAAGRPHYQRPYQAPRPDAAAAADLPSDPLGDLWPEGGR